MPDRIISFCLLTVSLLFFSCDMTEPPPVVGEASVFSYSPAGQLDLLEPGSSVSFTAHLKNPQSEPVEAFLIQKSVNGSQPVEIGSVNTWPVSLSYTLQDLLADWPGVDPADLRKGDVLSFLLSPQGESSRNVHKIDYSLGCSSELAGAYLATTTGRSGPGGGGVFDTIRYEVELSDLGNGRYEISELSGGMYPTVWGAQEEAGLLIDSCAVILLPSQKDQWDDEVSGSGLILETGKLSYQWENGYGDQGKTILEKK